MELLLQLRHYQIYNKNFVQYNGTGQTFLKVLRSKIRVYTPVFQQQQQQKTKQKTKQKKEIFLFQIVWTFLFLQVG